MHPSTDPWVWVAVFFTLSVFSFLWKDNIFYKFAESVTVGIGMGYGIVLWWTLTVVGKFWEPFVANFPSTLHLVIPALMGLLMITRIVPKYAWLSRYSLALLIGASSGYALPRVIQTGIMQQLYATMLPVSFTVEGIFYNLIIVVGVLSGLVYFFFSKEHKGWFGGVASVGIWFLMIGFGATFGYTVMARLSLFIGRIIFLLKDAFGMQMFN